MPTIFIDNLAVPLPRRFSEGSVLSLPGADLLNSIHHRRIVARLRYLVDRNEIAAHELQAKANELWSLDLVAHATLDDTDDADPVMEEALAIARDLIVSRMAQEGLPPPKGLETHAKALVNSRPEIQERARQRIEARMSAASAALSDIA